MAGYYLATGNCAYCGQVFTFNPQRVPSIQIDGCFEPICKECVAPVNVLRKAAGSDLIVPLPDAYEAAGLEFADGSV